MKESHKILFNEAIEALETLKPLHDKVSGQALLPGHENYKDWAKCSDELRINLSRALHLLKIIKNETHEQ